MTEVRLTNAQARRIALAAQGIGRVDRDRPVTMRQVQSVVDGIGQFQIDSVNVLVRAHLMPLFSRLGRYDTALLTRAASQAPRRLFEYWGHAASLIDVCLYPALRFRMATAHPWASIREIVDVHPDAPDALLDAIRQRGPSTARDLNTDTTPKGRGWWNWSSTKTLLEWLFHAGRIAVVRRNNAFERVFDLPEQVLPPELAQAPPLARQDAHVVLVRRAAKALGVATARGLADYFRTSTSETLQAIGELEDAGELVPTTVDGTPGRAWLWHEARRPKAIEAATLISPFDSLAFERVFDLPERVLPEAVGQSPPLARADAHIVLVRRAAQALGVATARSLGDYFRTSTTETRKAIDALAATGELLPAKVDGASAQAWLWHEARRPRAVNTATLVSPFDSVAFERRRLAGLFGVDYTIGLYTPAAQRTHGYYVYLFILDDAIVARTDLKADRQAGVLRVQSAWLEDAAVHHRDRVARALVGELYRLARWLALKDIAVTGAGDLSADVGRALG